MNLEKKTIEAMIDIYCKDNHYKKGKDRTTRFKRCPICSDMSNYALHKIEICPFKENKPVCSKCKVKCYNINYKGAIKEVMRYSGPRIILYHPFLLLRYVFRKKLKITKKTY